MRRALRLASLLVAMAVAPVRADDQAVTYVVIGGRYVELTGTLIPCRSGGDGLMAVEANDLAGGAHQPDNTDLAVYCWKRLKDGAILYRPDGDVTIPEQRIQLKIIDRPESTEPASSGPPVPA